MKSGTAMSKQERILTVFLYGVFICYILFLFKLLFLSRVSLEELFKNQRDLDRSINLIPFNSIKGYIFSSSDTIKRFAFSNVVGNMIMFVPLGVYLLLFRNDKRVSMNMLIIFAVSLLIEIVQGVFVIGTADIDDIILNCLGGLVGILGYKFLVLILRNENRVRIAIAIFSAIGLPILLYLLFAVRLRL